MIIGILSFSPRTATVVVFIRVQRGKWSGTRQSLRITDDRHEARRDFFLTFPSVGITQVKPQFFLILDSFKSDLLFLSFSRQKEERARRRHEGLYPTSLISTRPDSPPDDRFGIVNVFIGREETGEYG